MMSGIAVMNTTNIVVLSEMPNQMMANIAQIADDTVLSTGSTGSKNSPSPRTAPSMIPSGTLTTVASTNPMQTRSSVMPTLCHRSPLATISPNASYTRGGPGRT